ncbi:PREDICTED: tripartite motif-containing protein 7-like [Gekko japonicus]|uniref:Tripartite motif-containing protein 7-like n=1 Tax=Gekko japonicus TaxID=146911 RepID=A0ABM1KJ37_GEKJA|nr:PREDICTED: tripartite motif-containing protein 7-like [Gekko japonicus]
MAAGGPVKELCEEASCSVCLDYFEEPVTIAQCGHNFCRACLTRSWGESGAETSCPQCRGKTQEGSLRPNQQLAKFVEIAKKFSPQGRKETAVKTKEGREEVCQKHREPLRFFCKEDKDPLCAVCSRSKEHKYHQVIPVEEKVKPVQFLMLWSQTFLGAGKGSICVKHQEPLKLFCKNDEALICVVCDSSTEHKYHDVVPTEEASQEYKREVSHYLNILKEKGKKRKMMAYQADIMKDSQDLLKQTKAEKQKAAFMFRQLHEFLEEQEELLLAQMDEVEKEVARKRDELMAKLIEEMSSFETIVQEMERKCQQLDCELLQDIRSTLQRYEEEKEKLEEPVVLPLALKWAVWDFCDITPFLEGVFKQFKDTVLTGLQQQKANVTLDPYTAYPQLIVSEDRKSLKWGNKSEALPPNPERFQEMAFVLGWEGFTAGRHFWEVIVKSSGGEWSVGVARKSVNRKAWINVSPEEGIWTMNPHKAVENYSFPYLPQSGKIKRIRVSLNYAGGRVAFFDADRAAPLYTFSGAAFSGEALHALFCFSKDPSFGTFLKPVSHESSSQALLMILHSSG